MWKLIKWEPLLDSTRIEEVQMQTDGTRCQDFWQGHETAGCTCRSKPDSAIINYKYYFYKGVVTHVSTELKYAGNFPDNLS